jgi:hypothetical protein
MAVTTLLDIAKANGSDMVVGLIEEVLTVAPEARVMPARTIKGLNFKTLVRTALPTAGFRDANSGSTPSKSTWENRLVEVYILNPRWECDKAVANAYEDGAQAFIALEAAGQMTAAMNTLGRQFYYGVNTTFGGDAKGHPGLLAMHDTSMVVDAGGTTESTCSSVWAVKGGPQSVQFVYGMDGELALSELDEQRVLDSNNAPYTAYVQELLARPGLQVANKYGVARIKKLTADANKGLTDLLLADLIAKFPIGYKPDFLFMSRRSLSQLKKSRTATNPSGLPAPTPTDYEGIPIVPTDSIVDTETLAL